MSIHNKLRELWKESKVTAKVLQDILVTLKSGTYDAKGRLVEISDTVMKASDVYKPEEIGNLFLNSRSTVSLALSGDAEENTLSAVIFPSGGSSVPVSNVITYNCTTGKSRRHLTCLLARSESPYSTRWRQAWSFGVEGPRNPSGTGGAT